MVLEEKTIVPGLQAGDFVVSVVQQAGCDPHAVFSIGMIDDEGAWLELLGVPEAEVAPVPLDHLRLATEAEVAAVSEAGKEEFTVTLTNGFNVRVEYERWDSDTHSFRFYGAVSPTGFQSDQPNSETLDVQAYAQQRVQALFEALPRDADRQPLFDGDRCEILRGKHQGTVETLNGCVFEGKMSFKDWSGNRLGQHKPSNLRRFEPGEKSIEILGKQETEATPSNGDNQQPITNNQQPVLSCIQNSELRTQNSEVGSQESGVSSYEYDPIEPTTPVWFSPNGDANNLVEGQAIARNGKGNVRIMWGEEQREADIPGEKVHWEKPELQLTTGFQSVPIALIKVGLELQPRVQMDEFAITEYAEAMAAGAWDWQKDPMIAYWDGASLLLSSGGHRYQSAVRAGLPYVSLEVRLGDRSDALLNAPCANMQHGVRMTSADKNRAIALILRDPKWQQESSRALARMLSERGFRVDHKKIESIRKGLASSGEMPQIEQRIVRRGSQTYTTKPAVHQDQHSLEEVQALYASIGEFSINGDLAKPYKFECIGVLQRFKSLDEAYGKFDWMRDRVAEKQKEYATTCVNCAKRVNLKGGAEFECGAYNQVYPVTEDPGASGCRSYRKRLWTQSLADREPMPPAAFTPVNPAIARSEPVRGAIVTGYSAKEGEEDLQLTGSVVVADGDHLRLENGGMVYRDSAVVEADPEQEETTARDGIKQAIARWAAVHESGWHDGALESVLKLVLNVLSNFEF